MRIGRRDPRVGDASDEHDDGAEHDHCDPARDDRQHRRRDRAANARANVATTDPAAPDEPSGHHPEAVATVTWKRGAVLALAVVAAVLPLRWVVSTQGPQRDYAVTRELADTHGRSRLFVVVGTDSRQRVEGEAGDRFGTPDAVTTEWADAVMLVRLHPATRVVTVLSLPRDLLVDVDGEQKLATTLESGGPGAVVRGVTKLTGLRPNHYVQLDFLAFDRLVDAVGGVTIDVFTPARDQMTGLELAGGPQHLDGAAALAYARSRAYEERWDGAWVPDADGDLGRIERQHRLLRAVAEAGLPRPSLRSLWTARALARHVTVDAGLSLREMLGLARTMSASTLTIEALPTAPLLDDDTLTSPFGPIHQGGVAYLRPAQPAASEAIARFVEVRR